MTEGRSLFIPLEISEMLHAALGPLADVLELENHRWAPMAKKVVGEYSRLRDEFMSHMHGGQVMVDVVRTTLDAADKVCDLTVEAVRESEDFDRWAEEVAGESA